MPRPPTRWTNRTPEFCRCGVAYAEVETHLERVQVTAGGASLGRVAGTGFRTSETDPNLAAAELLCIDVFGHQDIAVGKPRRAEGIEKQLPHVSRRHRREAL